MIHTLYSKERGAIEMRYAFNSNIEDAIECSHRKLDMNNGEGEELGVVEKFRSCGIFSFFVCGFRIKIAGFFVKFRAERTNSDNCILNGLHTH